ncbi:MAG: hypothetical protein P9L92_15920 [Candidatus Electryonea clarkiae]|nr:hypothetical protein [Candidatus Electryonea clarkiae]MDP8285799.1 hypothetical protein [Candidatus Electryonea clarkiae]
MFYPDSYHINEAELVAVEEDDAVEDIDFILRPGGRISGSVVPQEGGFFPPNSINAEFSLVEGDPFAVLMGFLLETARDYTSPPFPESEYLVRFRPEGEDLHLPVYAGGAITPENAEPVQIIAEVILEHVDAALPLGGGISGTVTGDGNPLDQVVVLALIPAPGGSP